jgi:hypothetical protein
MSYYRQVHYVVANIGNLAGQKPQLPEKFFKCRQFVEAVLETMVHLELLGTVFCRF